MNPEQGSAGLDLSRLKELASKAMPGPWWVEPESLRKNGEILDAHIAHGTKGDLTDTYNVLDHYNVDTDYEYIAAANPQTMLALLERLETLTAEMERYKRLIATFALTNGTEGTKEDWDAYAKAHDELVAVGAALPHPKTDDE